METSVVEKRFRKYSTKQLKSKLEGAPSGTEKEVIEKILAEREGVSSVEAEVEGEKVVITMLRDPQDDYLKSLRDMVDKFVDELIESKRSGVYFEVMKALGGRFDSDLDELLEAADESQLKDALSFKGCSKKEAEVKKEEPKRVKSAKAEPVKKSNTIPSDSFEVSFKSAGNSKFPNETMTGMVIKQFACPKTKKLFYKIKNDRGIFLKKADSCAKI